VDKRPNSRPLLFALLKKRKIIMRKVFMTVAALMVAGTAQAADLPVPGLSLDTEVKAFHKVDAETSHITIEPELRYTHADGPLSVYGSTLITAYDGAAADDNFVLFDVLDDGSRPDITLGAEYTLGAGAMVYGETTWDVDASDRGEIEVGVSFNF